MGDYFFLLIYSHKADADCSDACVVFRVHVRIIIMKQMPFFFLFGLWLPTNQPTTDIRL